jgi:hypothetical protein
LTVNTNNLALKKLLRWVLYYANFSEVTESDEVNLLGKISKKERRVGPKRVRKYVVDFFSFFN